MRSKERKERRGLSLPALSTEMFKSCYSHVLTPISLTSTGLYMHEFRDESYFVGTVPQYKQTKKKNSKYTNKVANASYCRNSRTSAAIGSALVFAIVMSARNRGPILSCLHLYCLSSIYPAWVATKLTEQLHVTTALYTNQVVGGYFNPLVSSLNSLNNLVYRNLANRFL